MFLFKNACPTSDACYTIDHTVSLRYPALPVSTDSNDEREMSGGFWKATIDKTWALKLPGGPPPARPAAMVMAEKARTSAEAEKRRVATAAEGSGGGKVSEWW